MQDIVRLQMNSSRMYNLLKKVIVRAIFIGKNKKRAYPMH